MKKFFKCFLEIVTTIAPLMVANLNYEIKLVILTSVKWYPYITLRIPHMIHRETTPYISKNHLTASCDFCENKIKGLVEFGKTITSPSTKLDQLIYIYI